MIRRPIRAGHCGANSCLPIKSGAQAPATPLTKCQAPALSAGKGELVTARLPSSQVGARELRFFPISHLFITPRASVLCRTCELCSTPTPESTYSLTGDPAPLISRRCQ
ncbi:hypothetical protein VTI74DRAFT_1060 [Chaetomium olivicolor]